MSDDTVKRTKSYVTCAFCDRNAKQLKVCSRCRSAFYCNEEHQQQHWPIHMFTCEGGPGHDCTANGKSNGHVSGEREANPKTKRHNPRGGGVETLPEMATALPSVPRACGNVCPNPSTGKVQRSFDQRPVKLVNFPVPSPSPRPRPRHCHLRNKKNLPHLSEFAAQSLLKDDYCVLDGVLSNALCDNILLEVQDLERAGALRPGKLAGINVDRSVRSDKIMWFEAEGEGNEMRYPHIRILLNDYMDEIVGGLNRHLGLDSEIAGKTKAMITCYPGDGSAYMRHIDNPKKDGRIVTCIMYLNKNWNVKTQGGLLRIFPTSKPKDYVDVAPQMNRMLLFWSDARNPHEVQPTHDIRYAVTLWYFDKKERKEYLEKTAAAKNNTVPGWTREGH